MKNLTIFQTVLIGVFVAALIGGVASFALYRGGGATLPSVTIWGTFPSQFMFQLSQLSSVKTAGVEFTYVEKDPATFESDFVEALASGAAPDLVLFPGDLLLRQQNKLITIPVNELSERDFKDTFIDNGDLFFSPGGALGVPFIVDPIIMYWNRNMFSGKGISAPPQYWDEFFTLAPKFNEKNNAGNLKKTVVALGETVNITNFKELLGTLIVQAGDPIIIRGTDGKFQAVLNENLGFDVSPTEAAVRFYTEFSNPVKPAFSWNKSLLDSRDAFVAEELGTYFGLGSELDQIRKRNPNLNFDVATLPQIRDGNIRATYGRVYAFVIPKTAKNPGVSFAVAQVFSSKEVMGEFSTLVQLPPARRDLLSVLPTDPYQSVAFKSAVMSTSWPDPSPKETTSIFRDMIDSVISGKARTSEAIQKADGELNSLIRSLGL